ncbi:hypothetical protein [Gimesia algae]|uniref:Uncharacterized protein n=1 Tax=Gimesia algae TaxID=2527971 RepID=A0A517V7J5_9PLAN|nr:hypothetical protein [Gimesia algae]QDT88976.1 hypothetical protein Pan161_05950 [Gimesia algae]
MDSETKKEIEKLREDTERIQQSLRLIQEKTGQVVEPSEINITDDPKILEESGVSFIGKVGDCVVLALNTLNKIDAMTKKLVGPIGSFAILAAAVTGQEIIPSQVTLTIKAREYIVAVYDGFNDGAPVDLPDREEGYDYPYWHSRATSPPPPPSGMSSSGLDIG